MIKDAMEPVAGAENLLELGLQIEECAEKEGEAKAQELVRTFARRGHGLTESNIWTHRQRARVLMYMFPNPTIREHLLLKTGGEGIIVRVERGKDKGKYVLSPFFQRAIEKLEPAPDADDEAAERYAGLIVASARASRGAARSRPTLESKARTIVESWKEFVEGHPNSDSVMAEALAEMVKVAIQRRGR